MHEKKGNADFGKRLRVLRGTKSQVDVARQLNITQSMLSRYENGTIPEGKILLRIARVWQVNLMWLLTGEGQKLLSEGTEKMAPPVAPALAYVIDIITRAFSAIPPDKQDELIKELIELVDGKKTT
jgi:transcriptional regulator with XRE-family HTH domain